MASGQKAEEGGAIGEAGRSSPPLCDKSGMLKGHFCGGLCNVPCSLSFRSV